jgi:hypothetical protein
MTVAAVTISRMLRLATRLYRGTALAAVSPA